MSNIKVSLDYRGSEGHVRQGIYELEDERLLGIAAYLLSAGHAKWTNEPIDAIEESPAPDTHDLQLKVHAGRVEVDNSGNLVTTKQPLSLAELRTRYKSLAGKGASPKWDAATLQAKIAELESADS